MRLPKHPLDTPTNFDKAQIHFDIRVDEFVIYNIILRFVELDFRSGYGRIQAFHAHSFSLKDFL